MITVIQNPIVEPSSQNTFFTSHYWPTGRYQEYRTGEILDSYLPVLAPIPKLPLVAGGGAHASAKLFNT